MIETEEPNKENVEKAKEEKKVEEDESEMLEKQLQKY